MSLDLLIPIATCYFIYSFFLTIVKNSHRKKMLKMLVDNNLVSSGENNISFKFLYGDNKRAKTNYLLPIALGIMGYALGLIIGSIIIIGLQKVSNGIVNQAISVGAPLFFASTGVVIAYFIEQKKTAKAEEKSQSSTEIND